MDRIRKSLCVSLASCIIMALSACGGGSSGPPQSGTQVAGNWQFAMQNPPGNSFTGGLQGGFLLQKNGSLIGQVTFSITASGSALACNSGTATITGTVSGQTVNLTAVVGTLASDGTPTTQTITLSSGTISSDNSTIQNGTYALTPGYANVNGQILPCGTAQDAGSWGAASVPPLSGAFQGFFHSVSGNNTFHNQDFPVSGSFIQGDNIGASSATITGTLVFKDPVSLLNDYPCLTTASVNGQISGSSVVLQIFISSGLDVGQIGGIQTFAPVTFDNTQSGYVLHNVGKGSNGNGYAVVSTKACPGGSLTNPGDGGNLCLAFGNSTACTQPVMLSPVSLTFFPQLLGSVPTTQPITLTNTDPSGAPLSGLSLKFSGNDSDMFYQNGGADFNGLPNFTVVTTGQVNDCTTLAPLGSSFDLPGPPNNSCTITISFSPQQSCPWLPFGSLPTGLPPAKCPGLFNPNVAVGSSLVFAGLTVNSPSSVDGDKTFFLPVGGIGLSALVPSTPELDFGSEDLGESSQAQTLSLINQGATSVQILPPADISASCNIANVLQSKPFILPHPPQSGQVPGLVVIASGAAATVQPAPPPSVPTVEYYCDIPNSNGGAASFQISSDTCSGTTLAPQQTCSLQIAYAPQPDYVPFLDTQKGLDYFLELNTVGDIDSGRFPVELKANAPGPLRMSPGAGLDFGTLLKGSTSTPLTITLSNDAKDNLTANFTAKSMQGADYIETDNCPFTLSPGSSCTLTFTFTPSISGFDTGTFTITYNTVENQQYGLTQYIRLRGTGQ